MKKIRGSILLFLCLMVSGFAINIIQPATTAKAEMIQANKKLMYKDQKGYYTLIIPTSWYKKFDYILENPEKGMNSIVHFRYKKGKDSVLTIYVIDRKVWDKMYKPEVQPPIGDVITKNAKYVYVAGFPQSNPYKLNSKDAKVFDSMVMSLKDVKKAFRVIAR